LLRKAWILPTWPSGMASMWSGEIKPTAPSMPTGRPACPFMTAIGSSTASAVGRMETSLTWYRFCSMFPARRHCGSSTTLIIWDWIWIRRRLPKKYGALFPGAGRFSRRRSCLSSGTSAAFKSLAPIAAPCGIGRESMRPIFPMSRCIRGLWKRCIAWGISNIYWTRYTSMAIKRRRQLFSDLMKGCFACLNKG